MEISPIISRLGRIGAGVEESIYSHIKSIGVSCFMKGLSAFPAGSPCVAWDTPNLKYNG